MLVGETPYNKEDGEDSEASQLQGLASDGINGCDRQPVSRDSASADQNSVTSSKVVQLLVEGCTASVADSLEHS